MSSIVIDARMYQESGIGRYLRNLLGQLQKHDSHNEYYVLHRKADYDNLVYHSKSFHKVLADFMWYTIVEQRNLLRILNSIKPDLVHFPHFNVPIFYNGKFVVTIHDLIHQHRSMEKATTHGPLIHKLKQIGYRKVFKKAVNYSKGILTPSNFVKNQLVNEWKIDPDKIVVTYESVDARLRTFVGSLVKIRSENTLKKFKVKLPYIFYVGNAHPHKNVEGLINAFLELRKNYQYLQLVLSGQDNYFWQKIKKNFSDEGIIYTGFITEEELAAFYKNAQIFVMPSFEEGFGLPILEAFACGCPVVSSNAASLPEVGGNAAIYFDPHSINDMVNKISKVLNNEKLRKDLVEKGKKRVKQFSWEKLARQTLEVYRECV